ncbi:prepilin-type N-terminal cleavage/methylation domain-containing protein [Nitrincola tibetensis]|uniref:Type II secretion system protein H n=2 Tax=Nitrincola TaxID=267849 RepID=A0A364NK05_9GAMM|nr:MULTISPECIES: GspH/FimT family pseudopilin [Nitrincola]EXJ10346.1 putative major pilin subunit [Nitrincola nitratireducens]RAU17364.1 prepilin-type N-terminal cleavage/methylation domain-containing protein [Nitrincola tibetensis]
MKQGSRQSGVSLIELMVSIAVLAIILFIGVPSFQSTLESSRARAITNDLAGALQLARSEALKRRVVVAVCISNQAQNGCDPTGNWSDGWLITALGSNEVVRVWDGVSASLGGNVIQAPAGGIAFSREGFIVGAVPHQIAINIDNHDRCININATGQVTVSIGACT